MLTATCRFKFQGVATATRQKCGKHARQLQLCEVARHSDVLTGAVTKHVAYNGFCG